MWYEIYQPKPGIINIDMLPFQLTNERYFISNQNTMVGLEHLVYNFLATLSSSWD